MVGVLARDERPREGAPVPPAWLSVALMALLLGAAALLARGLAPPLDPAPARRGPTAALAILRDPLTTRLKGEDGRPVSPREGWGSAERPLRLRFVPSADVLQSAPTVRRVVDFLRQRTGYHVEGATLQSYGLVVQEIVQGKCEVAFLTAASYARARYATEGNDDPGDDIEAFLQVVREGSPDHPDSELAYRAALIVRADSPLSSPDRLTEDHVVAMGSPVSGASSILPTAYFRRLGVSPRVQRYGGYPFIVNAVLQGAVDVGCVWWSPPNERLPRNDARQLVAQERPDVFERTRIIGYTPWIPNEPVVIRRAVPDEVRHVLARALCLYASQLTLSDEGRRELVAVGSPVGFLPATNGDFLPLMEVIEQAFADDPEGRRLFMAGSR